jgi:crotonobetainyl-CoA:carnitine CoA-transferase CaiB-like acyl-CoA transferase
MLEERLVTNGADHWYTALTAVGVPSGPINDIATAFELATTLDLQPVVAVDGSDVPFVANPVRMSKTPPTYRLAPAPIPDATGN